jgi:5'-nucleotidase
VLIHQGGRTTDYFDQQDCSHLTGPVTDVVKRLDPAIRVVVSGHSHKGYLCKVDGRLVTEADMGGHVMTRIALTVDTATNTLRDAQARNVIVKPGQYPADPAVDAYLAKVRARSADALARPVARLAVHSVKRERHEGDESALGDLVADANLAAGRPFGSQIAFVSNGGMRQDLDAGPDKLVTSGRALMVLPFGNSLVVMNMTGAQIYALLEQQWLGGRDITRGLLQVSEGFSYQYDANLPVGSRVVPGSVMLNNIPLESDSRYRVVVNNFLAEGGEGFTMFAKGSNMAETGIRDVDALSSYLVKREQTGHPAGTTQPLGRIKRKP